MRDSSTVAVIIPAFNEEASIGKVIAAIPDWVDDIVVVDNASTDGTADAARTAGARIVDESRPGYGSACLAGIAALDNPDIVVFLDADFSDHPDEMDVLVDPIAEDRTDIVIGSRVLGDREKGALVPHARFGNWLACTLIKMFWNVKFTDLGPFRSVRRSTLEKLDMRDTNFGWTVELQVKAARDGLRIIEAPVSYRCRIGRSKISGTVKGTVLAGTKILSTIFAAALGGIRSRHPEDR
jgi:glycosyltransferase involved in cell wall biosynthesis